MPPVLVETIAYNLNSVGYFIGNTLGKSYEAYNTWEKRKDSMNPEIKEELKNIAKARKYNILRDILE